MDFVVVPDLEDLDPVNLNSSQPLTAEFFGNSVKKDLLRVQNHLATVSQDDCTTFLDETEVKTLTELEILNPLGNQDYETFINIDSDSQEGLESNHASRDTVTSNISDLPKPSRWELPDAEDESSYDDWVLNTNNEERTAATMSSSKDEVHFNDYETFINIPEEILEANHASEDETETIDGSPDDYGTPNTKDNGGRSAVTMCSSKDEVNFAVIKTVECHDKLFYRKSLLGKHQKTDLTVKLFKCPICEKPFHKKNNLTTHKRTVHSGTKHFQCIECAISFSRKANYDRHNQSKHSKLFLFECNDCSKTFSRKQDLICHVMLHSDAKPAFQCTECTKSFYNKRFFERHKKSVHLESAESIFICQTCVKTFNRKENLQRHNKDVHFKIKPYQCTKCEKSFSRKFSFIQHQKFHTG